MKRTSCPIRPFIFLALGTAIIFRSTFVAFAADDQAPVQIYSAAPDEPLSTQFVVKAEDKTVPVYLATVLAMTPEQRRAKTDSQQFTDADLGRTSFASFDLRGDVHVTVTCPGVINAAKLLPSSSGIKPQVSGNSATFTISKPGQFVLEVNGDAVHSLQIFANPWDSNAPRADDPKVIYYGPGIHKVTSIKVSSGQTVYIAADAVIYGTPGSPSGPIFDLKGDNITLRGCGIIDGSLCPYGMRNMICAEGRNISVEGIILRDSGQWTFPIMGSDLVAVKNVKIFGYRGNSDGIDIDGSQDVDVSDSYLRTGDDLIVIKSNTPEKKPTHHVTVERCILWNEFAHALSLGAEMQGPVDDIHFSDCDVIHDEGREWLLRIYQTDAARVSNVIFKDIRIEECREFISLWIGSAVWSKDAERGHINDITFQNIHSPVPAQPGALAELMGFDAEHAIHGVNFDHVVVGGEALKLSDVKQNQFVEGVNIAP